MLGQITPAPAGSPIQAALAEFIAGIVAVIPKLLTGAIFLTIAYIGITIVLSVLRSFLERTYPEDERLIADLLVAVVGTFLWFGAALALLKILGMGEVAASLGTATGFVALGVALALREMIADTVAGVYLLRDPDFNIGDRINTASTVGEITRIDLRKTRIRTDAGELVVVANRDVEKRWVVEPAGSEGS